MKKFKKLMIQLIIFFSTASESALSCCGVLAIFPPGTAAFMSLHMVLASLAAVVAGIIEFAIYRQNVQLSLRFDLKRSIAKRLLTRLLEANIIHNNSFLNLYSAQKAKLDQLEKKLEDYAETKEAEKEIAIIKKRIDRMENLFIRQILSPSEIQEADEDKNKEQLGLEELAARFSKDEIEAHIKSKETKLSFSKVCSFFAGISCIFVTFFSLRSAATSLLSTVELGYAHLAFSIGLAYLFSALAGVGYILLMYRTFSYLVHSDFYTRAIIAKNKYMEKIRKTYGWDRAKILTETFLSAVVILAVIGIVVVATIATAGTWWIDTAAITAGTMPFVQALGIISWVCMLVPTLVYSLVNTVRSIGKLPGILSAFFRRKCKNIKSAWDNSANPIQWFNIPYLVSQLFDLLVFFAHIAATGAASNSSNNIVSSPVAIMTNGFTEFSTDAHQLLADAHDVHSHHEHGESKEEPYDDPAEMPTEGSSPDFLTNYALKPSKNEEEEDSHDHHQNPILGGVSWVLKIAAVGWDFSLGGLGRFSTKWEDSKRKFFPKKESFVATIDSADESKATWERFEILDRCDKNVERLQSRLTTDTDLAAQKIEILTNIRKKVVLSSDENLQKTLKTIAASGQIDPLKKHRHGIFGYYLAGSPKSVEFLNPYMLSSPASTPASSQ